VQSGFQKIFAGHRRGWSGILYRLKCRSGPPSEARIGRIAVKKREIDVSRELEKLLEKAKAGEMTAEEKEAQRRSFAYGNAKIENERITRETVDKEAEKLEQTDG
jgi:hypothetical protein